MDMSYIATAISGIQALKIVIEGAVKASVKYQVLGQLGEMSEALFRARGDLLQLQSEKSELSEQLKARENWEQRLSGYKLVRTTGGAYVYESSAEPKHFACPSCVESRREIHIIQGIGFEDNSSCPGCKVRYLIEPGERRETNVVTDFDVRFSKG